MTSTERYGPYEIVAPLSAGGMGEVFRARDTRLNRVVALKILPKAFAADADRRRRFFQEAQAAGALNHPNILSIHDVDLDGDTPFLVTELIEGSTLRDQIDRGPLGIRRVLDLGAQIAAGLQAAHTAGIVHRDLKPENVMISRDGRVKILDFGLAKTLPTTQSGIAQTQTESGVLLGTVPYMSPQQARGQPVDYRSDQFSFGLMLYEMLAGTHPFRRESGVQTMSAIIADEPRALADLNSRVPLQLRWIVERCLAKDPAGRYASTTDLARDLMTLHLRFAEVADVIARPRPTRTTLLRRLAAVTLALVAVAVIWRLARPAINPMASYRFTPLVTDAPFQSAPAWSWDGRSLAYVSQVAGVLQVFTRSLASSSLRVQLTRSLFDCSDPFWSPDGSTVYYHSQAAETQGVWSISAAGGEPQLVLGNASRATLGSDGRRIAFLRQSGSDLYSYRLMVADAFEAEPRQVSIPEAPNLSDAWLGFNRDGTKLLVWFSRSFSEARQFTLVESPFRLVSWPGNESRSVLDSSLANRERGAIGSFDWLPDDRHVVISVGDSRTAARRLWLADIESDRIEPLTATPSAEGLPNVTHDGSRIAFTSEAVDFDLVSLPLDGSAATPLLATSRNEFDASWARDGSQFVFVTDRSGTLELWLRSADGQFERPLVTDQLFAGDSTRAMGSTAFSPDGTRVAFQRLARDGAYRIFVATTAAATPPVEFWPGGSFFDAPSWSPDGAWLAVVRGIPGGESHLVKARVGGSSEQVTLSRNVLAFSRPEWSPDGRHVLFVSNDGLALVPANGGEARLLSEEPWIAQTWSADGRRVIGLREAHIDRHFMLVSLDVASGVERIINPDLGVIPPANQPIRGLSRLGTNAVVTSLARARSDIWMLEGFATLRGTGGRLWDALFPRP